MESHITTAFHDQPGTDQQQQQQQLHHALPYLLTHTRYTTDLTHLLALATSNATQQWTTLSTAPSSKDPKYTLPPSLLPASTSTPTLAALLTTPQIRTTLDQTFISQISALEAQNEAAFSTFWLQRVTLRLTLHNRAIAALTDEKLKTQLSDALASYAAQDLIPSAVAKARARGLVRSRRTRKNVARLEAAVAKVKASSGAADGNSASGQSTSVVGALDRFAEKQGVRLRPADDDDGDGDNANNANDEDVLSASLHSTKSHLVSTLGTRMQRTEDGATLFLLLIVVLLARFSDGVVYATGRFAPRLMKAVKSDVGDEVWASLEDRKSVV